MKENTKKVLLFVLMPFLALIIGISAIVFNNQSEKQVYAANGVYGFDATWQYWQWNVSYINNGSYVWFDGTSYYYSGGSDQYILDTSNMTWSVKTWFGYSSFYGLYIWTDGVNYYYSRNANQYVLDVATSTWSAKTWNGLTSFNGNSIWTDGVNYYYSDSSVQYVLDVATSTWSAKAWNGLSSLNGNFVWTDGVNYYYSFDTSHYVLDVATSTWSAKIWNGLTSFRGQYIVNISDYYFYIRNTQQYVLDVATSTWSSYIFNFDNNLTISSNDDFRGDLIYFIDNVAYFYTGTINSGFKTLRLVMSNSGSGGSDTPVVNFTGATLNVPCTFDYYVPALDSTFTTNMQINTLNTQFGFSVDNGTYSILFNVDYLRYYYNSNSANNISQSINQISYFGSSISNVSNNNVLNFTSSDFGSTLSFVGQDNATYTDMDFGGTNRSYKNTCYFFVSISQNFEDFDFWGVQLYSTYTQNNGVYSINNHIKYFDFNEEYIDISVLCITNSLDNIDAYSSRYYYFSNGGNQAGSESYDNGYQAGYTAGLNENNDSAYAAGQTAGYNTGYQDGVDYVNNNVLPGAIANATQAGYQQGVLEANDYSFYGLITSVIDAPINTFQSLFNFEILGVNILSFLTGLLTLGIVLFLIKLVAR